MALRTATSGAASAELCVALSDRAHVYNAFAQYREAVSNYKAALELAEKVHGPHHPDVAAILTNLSLCLRELGEWEQARPLSQRALDIHERNSPDSELVASACANLGLIENSCKRFDRYLRRSRFASCFVPDRTFFCCWQGPNLVPACSRHI